MVLGVRLDHLRLKIVNLIILCGRDGKMNIVDVLCDAGANPDRILNNRGALV